MSVITPDLAAIFVSYKDQIFSSNPATTSINYSSSFGSGPLTYQYTKPPGSSSGSIIYNLATYYVSISSGIGAAQYIFNGPSVINVILFFQQGDSSTSIANYNVSRGVLGYMVSPAPSYIVTPKTYARRFRRHHH